MKHWTLLTLLFWQVPFIIFPIIEYFFKGQTWWTANNSEPYLIKGGIRSNSYIIRSNRFLFYFKICYFAVVSDCFQTWVSKCDEKTIRFNHSVFNRSIKIERTSDILGLMEDFLVKGDSKAEMEFKDVFISCSFSLILQKMIYFNSSTSTAYC